MPRPIITSLLDSTVLRLFPAGGTTTPQDWLELAESARSYADANIYLSAHSAVELRNLKDSENAAKRLSATSLHTSSCRVVASPLSKQARHLAQAIGSKVPESAAESLLIGVDGGEGSITCQQLDVCVQVADDSTEVQISTSQEVIRTTVEQAPDAVSEIVEGIEVAHDEALSDATLPTTPLPIGWLADHMPDGRVELGVGLFEGVMSADIAELVGRMEVPVTITPWKGLIFHDLAEGDADVVVRVLAPRGLIFDVNSPFL